MPNYFLVRMIVIGSVFVLIGTRASLQAQITTGKIHRPNHNRGWSEIHNVEPYPRLTVLEKSLIIHPSAEARPALKHRLIPSEFEREEGNAAVHYIRAEAFLERSNQREALHDKWKNASKEARQKNIDFNELPPYSWQFQSANELAIDDVKEYLKLTDFQVDELASARLLTKCDFNRNLRKLDNPYALQLTEVQGMREIARNQSLRCRIAIAEGRFEDAFATLAQQYSMANHLSQDIFVVSTLVAGSIAEIAWNDALDAAQMPKGTNLYWAYATLPRPLISLRNVLAHEKEMVFLQFKALLEVKEDPLPASHWNEFIDRILVEYNGLAGSFNSNSRPLSRFEMVNFIGAGYPGARRYLIEVEGLDSKLVDSYPIAQTFFLAQKKYAQWASDEQFKWSFLDYSNKQGKQEYKIFENRLQKHTADLGWAGVPAEITGTAVTQVESWSARIDSQLALLQTIESIRIYAAKNNDQLPKQLSDLELPAPFILSTGQEPKYELDGETAILTAKSPGIVYRLKIKLAK